MADNMLTVTLTDRAPVRIDKDVWGIIASSEDKDYDGQHDFQANRMSKWKLIVREHDDLRRIVYGIYSHESRFQGERSYRIRGGEVLEASEDVPAAIRRVGEWMARHEHAGDDASRWTALINGCIADLPAVELV